MYVWSIKTGISLPEAFDGMTRLVFHNELCRNSVSVMYLQIRCLQQVLLARPLAVFVEEYVERVERSKGQTWASFVKDSKKMNDDVSVVSKN